jgi:tetratricopeptide (TPR) repeat protein
LSASDFDASTNTFVVPGRQAQQFEAHMRAGVAPNQSSGNGVTRLTLQQAFGLALQHHQAGRFAEAEKIYRQILASQPGHAGSLHNLGVLAHQAGRSDVAANLIRQAIAAGPDSADAHNSMGNVLRTMGDFAGAVAAYQQAIAIKPDYTEAHANLGAALVDAGRFDEAIAACQRALALRPGYAEAQMTLGNALLDSRLAEEAVAAYRQAIIGNPESPEAHYNLGAALRDNGQFDEAAGAYRRAIALRPDYADAHNSLGIALAIGTGRLEEASACVCRALALRPDFAEAHWNLGWMLMLRGDFLAGWKEFEWRWEIKGWPPKRGHGAQPQWDGSDLKNRTIVIDAEQGFGDTIQFIRYVPLVARRAAKVIVVCKPELHQLMQSLESGAVQWLDPNQPVPPYDVHCSLWSLPLAFRTTLETVPNSVPYFYAQAPKIAYWRKKLAGEGGCFNIGLRWAGSPKFRPDIHRSPRELSLFAPLANIGNIRFVSLQTEAAAQQAAHPPEGMNLVDWTDELSDFSDTAALIANLDLVISSDNVVTHLAGAMGKPVWMVLPFIPDWRWMLDREDSPWYPTLRLFRQPSLGDWNSVVARVADALREWVTDQSPVNV